MRNDPVWAVFLTTICSHLCIVPAVLQLLRRRWAFEAAIGCFAFLTSFMYHTCQTFGIRIYLSELQWHRLDNIGALSTFGGFFVYLSNLRNPMADLYLKWLTLLIAIVIQEDKPWDERNTFYPILLFITFPIIAHVFIHQRPPHYDWKSFVMVVGMLCTAVPFFVLGLDDQNDPFRFYHGMWHVFGGFACFWMFRIVKHPHAQLAQVPSTVDARGSENFSGGGSPVGIGGGGGCGSGGSGFFTTGIFKDNLRLA